MRAEIFLLFLVLPSLIVKDVVGYAVEVKVKSDGNDEVSALQMLLQFTVGRKHHLCINETLPEDPTPDDNSKPCDDEQRQLETSVKPCEVVTTTPKSTPVPHTAVPDPTTIPAEPSSVNNRCLDDFIQLGNRCYYFNTTQTNWHDALKACQSKGATLAYPLNAKENSLIVEYLRANHKGFSFWLGGSDEAEEGKFVWAPNGIPIGNWSSGEPNDGYGKEDCLHIWHAIDWRWNDDRCTNTNGQICQQHHAYL